MRRDCAAKCPQFPSATRLARRGEEVMTPEDRRSRPAFNVTIVNQTGSEVEARERQTRDGGLEVILAAKVNGMIRQGRFDHAMSDRYGAAPAARR